MSIPTSSAARCTESVSSLETLPAESLKTPANAKVPHPCPCDGYGNKKTAPQPANPPTSKLNTELREILEDVMDDYLSGDNPFFPAASPSHYPRSPSPDISRKRIVRYAYKKKLPSSTKTPKKRAASAVGMRLRKRRDDKSDSVLLEQEQDENESPPPSTATFQSPELDSDAVKSTETQKKRTPSVLRIATSEIETRLNKRTRIKRKCPDSECTPLKGEDKPPNEGTPKKRTEDTLGLSMSPEVVKIQEQVADDWTAAPKEVLNVGKSAAERNYQIEKILDMKQDGKERRFLLKFVGYSRRYNLWTRESNINPDGDDLTVFLSEREKEGIGKNTASLEDLEGAKEVGGIYF